MGKSYFHTLCSRLSECEYKIMNSYTHMYSKRFCKGRLQKYFIFWDYKLYPQILEVFWKLIVNVNPKQELHTYYNSSYRYNKANFKTVFISKWTWMRYICCIIYVNTNEFVAKWRWIDLCIPSCHCQKTLHDKANGFLLCACSWKLSKKYRE